MNRIFLLVLCLTFIYGCASQKSQHAEYIKQEDTLETRTLLLSYAGPTTIPFSGLPNYDQLNIGGGAGVAYPGGHAAVFLASILTHAVIVDSAKEAQRTKIQQQADKVLLPYQNQIELLSYREMISGVLNRLTDIDEDLTVEDYYKSSKNAGSNEWVFENNPRFFMLQDEGAILVQNTIVVYSNEETPKIIYQNVVEVISQPYQGDSPRTYWTAENGTVFKELSTQLVADSVQLAIDDLRDQFSNIPEQDQTFHFYQEGKKAYERGRLVSIEADRLTIRTLRGWLKSVPIISDNNPYFFPLDEMVANVSTLRGIGIYY